jgi:hypothetical protein
MATNELQLPADVKVKLEELEEELAEGKPPKSSGPGEGAAVSGGLAVSYWCWVVEE